MPTEPTRSQGVLDAIKRLGMEEVRLRKVCGRLARQVDAERPRANDACEDLAVAVNLVAEGFCNMMIETAREERAAGNAALLEVLERHKAEILSLRDAVTAIANPGQAKCTRCGAWSPAEAPFCLRCGTDVDSMHANAWKCRTCGRVNGPASRTCGGVPGCSALRLDWQGTEPDPDIEPDTLDTELPK